MIYIAVDGGTTNTRINLVKDGAVADTVKIKMGARACMSELAEFKKELKNGIYSILSRNGLSENDIEKILASGMITCEFGLCPLEHIVAPAGIKEMHEAMHEEKFPDISSVPFVFIRGVKTNCENLENADMMRGEETELIGIANNGEAECIYILPGTHSKIIYTDKTGRISDFSTMMTGEMIESLSQHTILKDAVDLSTDGYDSEYLQKGFSDCRKNGINNTLFKTRILKNLFDADKVQCYSYFMGAVLCGEIDKILKSKVSGVVIGGKEQIKLPMKELIENNSDKNVTTVDAEKCENASAIGAVRIYEYK